MIKAFIDWLKASGDSSNPAITSPVNSLSNPSPTDKHITKLKIYHEENFQQVDAALTHTAKQLRKSIAKKDDDGEMAFTRIYTMLLGVWCEARLHKLLYEKSVFTEAERALIYNQSSLSDKWKIALETSLKKNSGINLNDPINEETIKFSKYHIYQEIKRWISAHFDQAFLLRNKIAHGQWAHPFGNMQDTWIDSNSFKKCENSIKLLNKENLLTTSLKIELLKEIATTINNLAIAGTSYQADDFDTRHEVITKTIRKLSSANYNTFKASIQTGYDNRNSGNPSS